MKDIPFNKAWHAAGEKDYVEKAVAGVNGPETFSTACTAWLKTHAGSQAVYLTHSCTAALEMAAILAGIKPGDEVIMPSFTFPSTANAFVLRGATPVFVDIRPDTLNIDESLIEPAVTPKTRAIVPMHYAGVACEMDSIMAIAERHGLLVIEDAAQSIGARYRNKPLGSIGHLGTYSFHRTKNVQCISGGALLINCEGFAERAEIVAEKGTNVRSFNRGETCHYTWADIGSAFLMSEVHAAILLSQLEDIDRIQSRRLAIWSQYHHALQALAQEGSLQLPGAAGHTHNGHTFHVIFPDATMREIVQKTLKKKGVISNTHYEPLHSSLAGKRFAPTTRNLPHTDSLSQRLLRLPLHPSLADDDIAFICDTVADTIRGLSPRGAGSCRQHS